MSPPALLLLAVAFAFPDEQGTRHAAEDSPRFKELMSDSWYHSPL